jgi:hypothetical protein
MIAPWFWSGNALCGRQFQRFQCCSSIRRNRLKVPAKFSSDIGLSPDDGVQGPEPLGSLRGFDQRDGTRAATAAAAGM